MIIDDAVDELELMRAVIEMVDPKIMVTTANGGEDALRILRESTTTWPSVILLDLAMPRMSGKEFLVEIKSEPLLKRIPVCLFSNGALDSDINYCYENGAAFYFRKPASLDDLKRFMGCFAGLWFGFASVSTRAT